MNELASATIAPAPAAAPQGQELAPEQAPQIPSPLSEVVQGSQPAALLPPVQPDAGLDPAQEFVVNNIDKLPDLGLDAVEAPDQSTIVFNTKLIDRKQIEAAVKDGTIQQLLNPPAPQAQPGNELAPPDAAATDIAQTRAAQRPAMPVQSAPMVAPKVPASTQTALANARVKSLGMPKASTQSPPVTTGNQLSKRPV